MGAEPSTTHSAMQSPKEPQSTNPWRLQRRVLPQHTDHAGVMWHGTYLAWLEEARVEALAAAGLAYADVSAAGYELPVVSLALDYRQALLHGESIQLESWVLPRRGLKLPWQSRFVKPDGRAASGACCASGRRPWRRRWSGCSGARPEHPPAATVQMY